MILKGAQMDLQEFILVFFLHSPSFEEDEHFKVLVKMTVQELSNGIPDSGHFYATLRASRTLTPARDLQETFSGMNQVRLGKGCLLLWLSHIFQSC